MTLERKYINDPDTWSDVVENATAVEDTFPEPPLEYKDIATRWSSDHHVVIGMRTATEKASTGFVQKDRKFVDRVFQVPWDQ